MKLLEGKKAVITGGSEGIGYAIAHDFVQQGAEVLLISRNEEKLQKAESQLSNYSSRVHTLAFDLSDLSAIPKLTERIQRILGEIDILVNNAAMAVFKAITHVAPLELAQSIQLNIQSPYLLSQQLLPLLLKTRGTIINISSYFSHKMISGRPSTVYSLTKGAIDAFTTSLANELGPKGVRVNAIAPGTVKTPLFEATFEKMTTSQQQAFLAKIPGLYPLGRIGEPEEVSSTAVFLASESAKWITGAIMNVDGGLTIT